jgi:hypothetical protein
MSKISLTAQQKAILNPIKERGGYSTITAVIGALIAIYGDDLLHRVSLPPMDTLLSTRGIPIDPISTVPQSTNTALVSTNSVPIQPKSTVQQSTNTALIPPRSPKL